MFPGNQKSGWPTFLDCVPVSQWRFDSDLTVWLDDELDKIDVSHLQSSADSTLALLSQKNYSRTLRFQTQAVEQYFSSEYFVAQFSRQTTGGSSEIRFNGWR